MVQSAEYWKHFKTLFPEFKRNANKHNKKSHCYNMIAAVRIYVGDTHTHTHTHTHIHIHTHTHTHTHTHIYVYIYIFFLHTSDLYTLSLCDEACWPMCPTDLTAVTPSPSHLWLIQNAAAHFLTGSNWWHHVTAVLASFHWLPCPNQSWFWDFTDQF